MIRAHGGGFFAGGLDQPEAQTVATLMIDADRDAMRASGDQFATKLQTAGVDLEYYVLPDSRHAFLNHPRLTLSQPLSR